MMMMMMMMMMKRKKLIMLLLRKTQKTSRNSEQTMNIMNPLKMTSSPTDNPPPLQFLFSSAAQNACHLAGCPLVRRKNAKRLATACFCCVILGVSGPKKNAQFASIVSKLCQGIHLLFEVYWCQFFTIFTKHIWNRHGIYPFGLHSQTKGTPPKQTLRTKPGILFKFCCVLNQWIPPIAVTLPFKYPAIIPLNHDWRRWRYKHRLPNIRQAMEPWGNPSPKIRCCIFREPKS